MVFCFEDRKSINFIIQVVEITPPPKGSRGYTGPRGGSGSGGGCPAYEDCGGGGGNGDGNGDGGGGDGENPNEPKDPCKNAGAVGNNPNLKSKIDHLKDFAKSSKYDEIGYKDNKDGTVTDADANGKHRVTIKDPSTVNGAYHNHTLNGLHMFSAHDISTMIEIARYNGKNDPSNSYVGMVSSENQYIIFFNGSQTDLPANTFSEYNLDLWDTWQMFDKDLMLSNSEYSSDGKNLNSAGLEKIFNNTLQRAGLAGKVNLIKVNDDGKTFQITQNPDGTTTPIPCP